MITIYALKMTIDKGWKVFLPGKITLPRGIKTCWVARDVIFPKPVKIPQGKVIFSGKKITSRVNPQNELVGCFAP